MKNLKNLYGFTEAEMNEYKYCVEECNSGLIELIGKRNEIISVGDGEKHRSGDRSVMAGGYESTLYGGHYSTVVSLGNSSTLDGGVAVARGQEPRVKGGLGSVLVCIVEDQYERIVACQTAIVDGKTIAADTWYTVFEGEFVLAD